MDSIRVLSKIEKDLEKVSFIGEVANIIMGNGKMVRSMEVDMGNLIKKILIWANGKMDKLQVMESIQHILDKNMKVNFKNF